MAAKIIKIAIPVVIIAVAVVAAMSLTSMRKPPEKKEEQRQAILVTAQPVEQQDLVYRIESQGTVKPRLETSLVSEVNGRIVEVADNFVEGGFFNPTLSSVKVKELVAGGAAEKAGVLVGDQILKIADCVIPGCPADDAKDLMKRNKGESVSFLIKQADGTELTKTVVAE